VISRLCEEFSCLPSAAVHELENDPERLVLRVLPLRVFASAKEAYESAKTKDDIPDHPMIDAVQEIEFGLAAEQLKKPAKKESE